jgi:hypothetical protein
MQQVTDWVAIDKPLTFTEPHFPWSNKGASVRAQSTSLGDGELLGSATAASIRPPVQAEGGFPPSRKQHPAMARAPLIRQTRQLHVLSSW